MTKKKIVIFISIVIAGCRALGGWAYYLAHTMSPGYKDVSKMDWSFKLSNKYTGIFPSDIENEFVFSTKTIEGKPLQGVMDHDGKVIVNPDVMVIPAGDGWYSVTSDLFGGFEYKNIKGITTEGWFYSGELSFLGNYAIAEKTNGQQIIMNKQGDIVRTLKTKNKAWMISSDYYGMYDEKNKRVQVLDIKKDQVIFESDKYEHIGSLKRDGYVAVSRNGDVSRVYLLGGNFQPLFGEESFDSYSYGYDSGILLVDDNGKRKYLDIKNNREAIKLPKDVIGANPFSEGIAIVYIENQVMAFDTTGKVVFKKPFKLGFDPKGEEQVLGKPAGDIVALGIFGVFSDGIAPLTPDGIHWGYVNKSGEYVVKPIFERAYNSNGGYGVVMFKGMSGILCL